MLENMLDLGFSDPERNLREWLIMFFSGSAVTGNTVVVNNTGRLGVVMSSARYKRDIRSMGNVSTGLLQLRPVTFRHKNDPAGIRDIQSGGVNAP
ncbi:MAG TPA: tail fiber domain-containing protein [Candidatus Binataceae bacterium]|jgi:hypothetical protein|nr:tail fiber domain-containing protein [Candidatus Binataceae bacterium]